MTPDQIREAILSDPMVHALVPDTLAVAQALSVGRTKVIERLVTERRILSVLGVVDGDAFLTALEEFSQATLPDGHPFKPVLPGLRRVLTWLKTDEGLDVGDPSAQAMLLGLAEAGVLNQTHAQMVMDLARVPDPIDEMDVRRALVADDGTLLVPPYIAQE